MLRNCKLNKTDTQIKGCDDVGFLGITILVLKQVSDAMKVVRPINCLNKF